MVSLSKAATVTIRNISTYKDLKESVKEIIEDINKLRERFKKKSKDKFKRNVKEAIEPELAYLLEITEPVEQIAQNRMEHGYYAFLGYCTGY